MNIVTIQISQYAGKMSAANSGDPNLIRDRSPRRRASLNYAELSSEQESSKKKKVKATTVVQPPKIGKGKFFRFNRECLWCL